eukprot:10120275-Alexandrium_andersonii.AAC.1
MARTHGPSARHNHRQDRLKCPALPVAGRLNHQPAAAGTAGARQPGWRSARAAGPAARQGSPGTAARC